ISASTTLRRPSSSLFPYTTLFRSRDRRAFLPDAAINANYVAAFLIDDGVENDGGLAGLAVADDQLALSAADRNHAVDRLDAGLRSEETRLNSSHVATSYPVLRLKK